MSKYKNIFDARKSESKQYTDEKIQKGSDMEIQTDGNPDDGNRLVNLGIKIAEKRRRFWVGQAKLRGVTISEIIVDALTKKFGEPE